MLWNCAVSIDIAWEKGFLLVCSESRRFLFDFIKATFLLVFCKVTLCQHNLFESSHFLCFLTETLATKQLNWNLWALYHKKTAIWFYHWKLRCFKLHNTDNMFCFVINNIGLPWALYRKKKCFCFFLAKTRCNQLYSIRSKFWFVCRKIVLLPVLLHVEKVFFQFAVSHPDFHFTLLKTTFLPVFS